MGDTNSFSLLRSAGRFVGGLAIDEIISFLLIGSIGTAALWFLRVHVLGIKTKRTSPQTFAIAITTTLLIAAITLFLVEAAQYFRAQTRQITAQLDEIRKQGGGHRTEPSAIWGSVRRCLLMETDSDKGSFVILFNLRLANPGRHCNVMGWKLRATLPGRQQYEYNPIDFTSREEHITATNMLKITTANYLPFMLLKDSVGPDRGAVGWVAFQVKNISKTAIEPQTRFELELTQGDGTKRSIEHVFVPDGPVPEGLIE